MSGSWQRCHRRYQLRQAVLAEVGCSGSSMITTGLRVQVEAEYGDLAGFLQELQYRWYLLFSTRLDAILETAQADVDNDAVWQLWQQLVTEQQAMWLLLQEHRDHPRLVAGEIAHRFRLRAAGIAPMGFTVKSGQEEGRAASAEQIPVSISSAGSMDSPNPKR